MHSLTGLDKRVESSLPTLGVWLRTISMCGRIWTRPRWQDSGELLRDRDRCMRISGFFLKARLAFEP
jgi:hypothetical protein